MCDLNIFFSKPVGVPFFPDNEHKSPTSKTIFVEKRGEFWCFTDRAADLVDEPFINGADVIMERLCRSVSDQDHFALTFDAFPFPDSTKLERIALDADDAGATYKVILGGEELVGWLCPATLKYFKTFPREIHFRALVIALPAIIDGSARIADNIATYYQLREAIDKDERRKAAWAKQKKVSS